MLTKSALFVIIFSVFTVAAKAQDFVSAVRITLDGYGIPAAESVLKQYRNARGITPEYLEAYSWLGRKALADRNYAAAEKYAQQTYEMSAAELKHRKLDAEPHLPTALGAAIEVRGQALAQQGDRAGAVAYLRAEEAKYATTSIAPRIQKTINLISLEGKPAPPLQEAHYLGPKPLPLAAYKGKPVILFFWAHWCVDCKAEGPILARLKQEYGGRLALVAPTQRYGYAAAGNPASPAEELKYIEEVRTKYYSRLSDAPVPVSEENFRRYGASTTPTLVLIGADGRVKLYHPGRMTYEELKAALQSAGLS
ncbi:MAG: redoxin family protein [Terriglobales bacterium]